MPISDDSAKVAQAKSGHHDLRSFNQADTFIYGFPILHLFVCGLFLNVFLNVFAFHNIHYAVYSALICNQPFLVCMIKECGVEKC